MSVAAPDAPPRGWSEPRPGLTDDTIPPAEVRGVDTAIGLVATGVRVGMDLGRLAFLPARLFARLPYAGAPVARIGRDLAHEGRLVQTRTRAWLEDLVGEVIAAPEVERAIDRALAGRLTDAVARSLVEHRVVERVASEVAATADVDRIVAAVLEHEVTQRTVERALASPGLEQLVAQVLDSPEMDNVVRYIATSPQVAAAVSRQTRSLAEEMTADVRRRSQVVDDAAERVVRGWLRRPRTQPS